MSIDYQASLRATVDLTNVGMTTRYGNNFKDKTKIIFCQFFKMRNC